MPWVKEMLARTESEIELDQGRLAQEVAYLSDRADISEEIARLRSHIEHFRGIMADTAAAKASCIASSARSRSPSRRTSVARILPDSAR